ncbi:MAG TPA: hypothetical protein VI542_27780 [Candidatus Tectomicrobia bacterium]
MQWRMIDQELGFLRLLHLYSRASTHTARCVYCESLRSITDALADYAMADENSEHLYA